MRLRPGRLIAAVVILCVVAVLAATLWPRPPKARLVTVVCRNMAFHVADDPSPNPTLHVRAGETIELELRNEDGPGVLHDLAIDPLGISTVLLLPGQTARVTFTAPDRPGEIEYYCRPHALIMRGTLEITSR